MKPITINLRRSAIVLVTIAASLAIAACGSSKSSGSSTTTASSGSFASRRAAFATCMKQHGVTIPNRRPSGSGGAPGAGGPPGAGVPPGAGGVPGAGGGFFGGASRNPKDAAAFRACGSKLGAGGFRRRFGGRFRLSHPRIERYVACVRKHGYNMPNPNFSGKGSVFPSSIQTNKKFQAASRACATGLVQPGGFGGGPPGSGSAAPGATTNSSS